MMIKKSEAGFREDRAVCNSSAIQASDGSMELTESVLWEWKTKAEALALKPYLNYPIT